MAPRRWALVAATEALTVGARRARAAAATASPAVIVWTSAGELRMRVRADDDAAPLARRLGLRSMADALRGRRADEHRVAYGAVAAGGMLVGALVVWARRAPIGAPVVALGVKRDMLMLWVPASLRRSSRAALHGLAHGALADDDRPAKEAGLRRGDDAAVSFPM